MTQGTIQKGRPDKFEFAGGYLLHTVELFTDKNTDTVDGNGYNIIDLVQNITIEESITSFALKATFTILDGVNLLDELKITGNERIRVKLKKTNLKNETAFVQILFYVTEYPLYGKSTTRTHQAYKIIATTEHGYVNQLLSLSKNIKGTPAEMIRKILVNELNVDEKKIDITKSVKGLYSYNAPSKRPFECVRDILRMTTDNDSTPLFLYETLNKIVFKSYLDIINQEPFANRVYKYGGMTQTQNAVRIKDALIRYENEASTILELSSNLKFSQIEQTTNGAYGLTLECYDFTEKKFTSLYKEPKEIETLGIKSGYSKNFKINNKEIKDYTDSCIKTYMTQSAGTIGQLDNKLPDHTHKKEAILARQENITHNINIYGDLNFSVGNLIEIEVYTSNIEDNKVTKKDEYLSGKYLVTNVIHNFSQVYTMDVRISKDGF